MMKLFSAIMAIYIMGLLFVPCADIHAQNATEIPSINTSTSHENHFDTCSPFCFCNCCQTVSYEGGYFYISFANSGFETIKSFIHESEYMVLKTLWRPPKI